MTKRERVEAAVAGKKADHVPVSAWCHFFDKEFAMPSHVQSMLDFQEYYDWDYMKIHPRFSYHTECWGNEFTQSGKPGDWPVCKKYAVHEAEDWKKLPVLNPREGVLGDILKAVEAIRKGVKEDLPIIMTVFSPLMIANSLSGSHAKAKDWKKFYDNDRDSLAIGLETIAETFRLFVEELKKIGIDGLYYATKEANDEFTSAKEYQEFVRPYDEIVLSAAKGFSLNMMHLCADKIHYKAMADYPVQVLHWDPTTPNNPDFKTARKELGDRLAFGGGPCRTFMTQKGVAAEIKSQLKKILIDTEERHFLLGPACSVLIAETPEEYIWLLRNAPEKYYDY
jgi:uroporphyrinogen decarboxylase